MVDDIRREDLRGLPLRRFVLELSGESSGLDIAGRPIESSMALTGDDTMEVMDETV